MIRSEYIRFLKTLKENDSPEAVRKIANIVFQHLDTLIPLSTTQGHRIKEIIRLSQNNWSSISSNISIQLDNTTDRDYSIKQLQKISIGPFRGFHTQEDFDLSNQIVLIYGPNGTGKSSFCEALEYGLLGTVAEAEGKRFRNQQDYLKNAYTQNFTPPVLIGLDNKGNDIAVSPDEPYFRFCFVEKTRIDNFSRIAAQSPSKQSELISSLFGLDLFAEFVRNFTSTMDGKYIDVEGNKSKELNEKRLSLAAYQQQIQTTIPEEFQRIKYNENMLASKYRENSTYIQMVTELYGTEGQPGLISQLEDCLKSQIPSKSNLEISELHRLRESIEISIEELSSRQKELAQASQQVSFKQLYEAVIQLKESVHGECPACHTPLAQVKINPFDLAESELKKLKHIEILQNTIVDIKNRIDKSMSTLTQIINVCCTRLPENNPLTTLQYANMEQSTADLWHSYHKKTEEFTPWEHIEVQVGRLESADKQIEQILQKRQETEKQLKILRGFAEEIVKLEALKKSAEQTKKKAIEAIEKFEVEHASLIAEVESEKTIIIQNKAISDAYGAFVQEINSYMNGLPAQLVANLGETVVTLYNAFNRNDTEFEQLSAVRLPLQQGQRLEISLKRDSDAFFDALHILSEGHIRCLGLAILTAKNIEENCPLLIFDDPVNSIDDEHREAIRKTLFEDTFFHEKQIILTCHGEEFFKDIQNLLSAEKARQSRMLSFLPSNGDLHICVDHGCSPRNYIVAARSHYDRCETRDALDKSRKALENILKVRIWPYVSKYGDGNLSIKMHTAKAPIGLRNLADQLRKKIECQSFADINKYKVLNPMTSLLGIDGNSREWRYFNKGTHEDQDILEFDRSTVNQIVTALEQMDEAFN